MDKIEKLKSFLMKTPHDSFLLHALALELLKADREEEAKQTFIGLLTAEPSYVGSYYHLAGLLQKMGETSGALEWYQKGMSMARKTGDTHAYNELQAAYDDLID